MVEEEAGSRNGEGTIHEWYRHIMLLPLQPAITFSGYTFFWCAKRESTKNKF
jgi:hypothetical protein